MTKRVVFWLVSIRVVSTSCFLSVTSCSCRADFGRAVMSCQRLPTLQYGITKAILTHVYSQDPSTQANKYSRF